MKESLGLDLLQNTNFVYHPESLLETQIFSLVIVFLHTNGYLSGYVDTEKISKDLKDTGSTNFLIAMLFAEHILSWLITKFRHYDIEKNGRMDINGVKRAYHELKLSSIQFFISCIILGFTIKHLFVLEGFYTIDQMKNQWIIIDCLITFFT